MRRGAGAFLFFACLCGAQEATEKQQGDLLFSRGREEFEARRYDAARRLFEQALPLFEKAGEPVAAAWAVSWVGSCHLKEAEYEKALAAREDALARMKAVYAGQDDHNVALSLNNVAVCLGELGRTEAAAEHLREALAMVRRLSPGNNAPVVTALSNLATMLSEGGRPGEAVVHFEESLRMRRDLGDAEQIARGLTGLGLCLDSLGRSREAFPLHEESLSIRERLFPGDHPQNATSVHNVAANLRALGRAAEAMGHYERGLAMRERLYRPDHPAVAVGLNGVALALQDLGRPAEAVPYLERALAIQRKTYRAAHRDVSQALNSLAVCLRRLGRADDALPYYRESLDIRREVYRSDHPETALALRNLGTCLAIMERFVEAEPLLVEALEMVRRLYPGDHPHVADALDALGFAHSQQGRARRVLPYMEEALTMRRRLYPEDHPDTARALNAVAACLSNSARFEESMARYREALDMARRLRDPAAHEYAANLGDLLVDDLGRPEEAVPFLEEAITQIEALRLKARALEERDRADYFRELKRYAAFENMVQAQLALGRPAEAFSYVERGRARGFMDLLERSRFDPVAEAERRARERKDAQTLVRLEAAAKGHREAEADVARLSHALTLAQGRRDATRAEIQAITADLARARAAHEEALRERARLVRDVVSFTRPDPPEEIQRGLAADEVMLVYHLADDGSFLLVVSPAPGAIRAFRLDGAAEAALAGAVDEHRAAITRRGDAATTGARLFGALVPPAAWTEIKGARTAYVVPHGPLHHLPFETLVPGEGRTWLDDGPPIVYAPSGTVLLWCRRRARQAQEASHAVLALGDPVFAGTGLAALPGSRREVLAIRDALGADRVVLLLGEEATKKNLFDLAPKARMLHLATHHVADERDGGSFSRLALTLPRVATPQDDGFLRLHEMFDRWRDRLGGCSLVVLSACETQRGPLQEDEGLYALPLGFLYAGCPSVIASLWRVEDQSTADLMSAFYRNLGAGLGKLEAFAAARKEVRARHAHPYFWAPFIFLGDPR